MAGITRAVTDFYSPDRKISVYVLGDDFQGGGSIDRVLDNIARVNAVDEQGNRRVRIHGIGFPALFLANEPSAIAYSHLMRRLTEANGGTFVGLHDVE